MTLTASSGLYENAFGNSFPRREDKEYIRNKVKVTFHDPKHATDELVEECFEAVNDRNKILRILSIAKSAIRHNMKEELPKITQKTCIIWGENDKVTPPEVGKEFHKEIQKSDLFWIKQCGHAPMIEQPKIFNEILVNWLKNQKNVNK